MKTPITIRFVGLAPAPALEAEIHAQVDRLTPLCPESLAWRFTVEQPDRHEHPGDAVSVRAEVTLPGRELAITRTDARDAVAALREAADALRRDLQGTRRKGMALSAGDICTRTVVFTDAGMILAEAARLMHSHHVGTLVVVEERSPRERIVVGMVTDRDLAMAVVALERDPHAFRIGDVMSRDVVTAREQDALLDVLAAMRRRKVRRLPVIGSGGELLGLVALDDVLAVVAEQMQALAAAIGAAQRHELADTAAG